MSPRQKQWEVKFERFLTQKFESEIAEKQREELASIQIRPEFDIYTQRVDSPSVRAKKRLEQATESKATHSSSAAVSFEKEFAAAPPQVQQALRRVFESGNRGVEISEIIDRAHEASSGEFEELHR